MTKAFLINTIRHTTAATGACVALLLGGCGGGEETEISYYTVPTEALKSPSAPMAPAGAPTGPMAGGGSGSSGGMQALPGMAEESARFPAPRWETPPGWVEQPATGLRRATFLLENEALRQQAELSVTVFPGDVGGLAANVNRWRGQIGLPALPPGAVEETTTALPYEGGEATVVYFEALRQAPGEAFPQAVLGAIVPRSDHTWFFKAQGDAPLLEAERSTFESFVRSLRFPPPQ